MSKTIKGKTLLSDHSNYVMHVGGNYGAINQSDEYIKQNKEIIKDCQEQRYIPKTYIGPYELMTVGSINNNNDSYYEFTNVDHENTMNKEGGIRYDPTDYMFKQGSIDNNVRYHVHYVNIDSSMRDKNPSYESERPLKLSKDPFKLLDNYGSKSTIRIFQPEHELSIGDKITINGVPSRTIVLRTKVGNRSCPFQFINGSQYLKIFYDDGSDPISRENPNKKNGGLADIDYDAFNGLITSIPWNDRDQSNLFIKINGFQGNSSTNPFIGNIPISTLNKRQRVNLTIPGEKFDNRVIYIKLIRPFVDKNSPYIFPTSYNVTVTFEYIAGIPINRINSQYPVDFDHLQGYQLITEVDKDSFSIDIYNQPGTLSRQFGGGNIYISKIINIFKGFNNPNKYSINLGRAYSDVVQISLVSSEFPNTVQNVKRGIDDMFYWENLEDGGHVYKAQIKSGNYTVPSLIGELQNTISSTPRIDFPSIRTQYINRNYINFDINTNTNIVTIKSFKQAILRQPIIDTSENLNSNSITLQIKHINHGLNEGDVITISGAVNHLGIPADVINGSHTVTTVNDTGIYGITLPSFNYLDEKIFTGGGSSFKILVPNSFRLRFDFKDSIGKILGFRNIGSITSITEYTTVITNGDPYEDEITKNEAGENISIKNNALSLNGYNYFLIMCKQIQVINDNNTNRSYALAKILLSGPSGTILFNTFVNTPHFYPNPIPQLYRLDLSFILPGGELHDFNGLDHSFTLKIVTVVGKLKGTDISNTAKIK